MHVLSVFMLWSVVIQKLIEVRNLHCPIQGSVLSFSLIVQR
jgi:hypothetical protein